MSVAVTNSCNEPQTPASTDHAHLTRGDVTNLQHSRLLELAGAGSAFERAEEHGASRQRRQLAVLIRAQRFRLVCWRDGHVASQAVRLLTRGAARKLQFNSQVQVNMKFEVGRKHCEPEVLVGHPLAVGCRLLEHDHALGPARLEAESNVRDLELFA